MEPESSAAWAADVDTHRRIRGRRWRVSDPRIPEPLRQALVDELMAARRAVRDADDDGAERTARGRVHDAKVALGERGVAWWLTEPDDGEVDERIRHAAAAVGRARTDLERTELTVAVADICSVPVARVDGVLGRA